MKHFIDKIMTKNISTLVTSSTGNQGQDEDQGIKATRRKLFVGIVLLMSFIKDTGGLRTELTQLYMLDIMKKRNLKKMDGLLNEDF